MNSSSGKTDTLVWLLLFVAGVSCVLVIGAFCLVFYDLPFSKDSGDWSNFGSYFGGLLSPILGVLNLCALLLIAVRVTEAQQKTLATKRLSLDLYSEWHEPSLHESRRVVSDLISSVSRNERVLNTLSELEQSELDLRVHAFRLYHFFEKWAVLVELNEVDEVILNKALASRALWYRQYFFEPIREAESNTEIRSSLDRIETIVFSKL
ncbi:MAG: hypothetical protein HWE39_08920 [Oceanospirillaceae bacterium]|nr:hypothetical protein [Oceanospirillaceae bacterium]